MTHPYIIDSMCGNCSEEEITCAIYQDKMSNRVASNIKNRDKIELEDNIAMYLEPIER